MSDEREMNETIKSGFDEKSYLARYADVRNAVKAGGFSSGYEHYMAFGQAEGRDGSAYLKNPPVRPLKAFGLTPSIYDDNPRTEDGGPGIFIELDGCFYQDFLFRMHAAVQPRTYFEVGTLSGDTLKLASCTCVSVDPKFQISSDVLGSKPACHFFQTGSDEFFEKHNASEILGGTIDIAFLDGMHLFEYLLRDFFNTERYCTNDSIIILHDCIPGDQYMTVRNPSDPIRQRSTRPGYWTGDVWKMIPILRQWRPDLRIAVVDAPPTGLALVTNLASESSILKDNYNKIVDTYLDRDLGVHGVERLHQDANLLSTEKFLSAQDFAEFIHRHVSFEV